MRFRRRILSRFIIQIQTSTPLGLPGLRLRAIRPTLPFLTASQEPSLRFRSNARWLSAPGRKFGDVFCSAGFQTCCVADFQIRKRPDKGRSADWEVGDTAGLETCVTSSYLRLPALRLFARLLQTPVDRIHKQVAEGGIVEIVWMAKSCIKNTRS